MTHILIIGKKSFIGSNLKNYLSNDFNLDIFSYEEVIRKNKTFIEKYTHVINASIHPYYLYRKYNSKFDLDLNFVKKFKTNSYIYIFLNSRKIYLQKEDIKENSKKKPKCNYGKNKLITEKLLKKKIKGKLLALRISNIIGKKLFKNKRKSKKLFYDNFLEFKKNKKKLVFYDDFKDFITIEQFSEIIRRLVKKNKRGVFNVSLGKKIYLSEITSWLDKKFSSNLKFKVGKRDSFTLSNKKLVNAINMTIKKDQLKKFCENLIQKK